MDAPTYEPQKALQRAKHYEKCVGGEKAYILTCHPLSNPREACSTALSCRLGRKDGRDGREEEDGLAFREGAGVIYGISPISKTRVLKPSDQPGVTAMSQ